jgi:hypothetical protein
MADISYENLVTLHELCNEGEPENHLGGDETVT